MHLCTPIPSELLAFELNADDMHEGLPPSIEPFFTLNQSILNKPWPTGHDGASGPCSHMASFLHDRDLVGICRWHGGLCLPTVISGSILGPI